MKFQELPRCQHCDMQADMLRELSFHFKQSLPNWQSMMSILHQGHTHPGQSSIQYLTTIYIYPGDKTCILPSLEFINNLAITHDVPPSNNIWSAPVLESCCVISASPQEIVLSLGTFHMLMKEGRTFFYLTKHSTYFYLRLYGIGHIVKDHSDSERKPAAATLVTLID